MKTLIFREKDYLAAASLIRQGKMVVFPTETVYGLGAAKDHPRALRNIYLAKGRPSDNPLILHISKAEDLSSLALETHGAVQSLIEAFWPGPLTLVLPKKAQVPELVTSGLPTVAVRQPFLSLARDFLEACGTPVAAPSANRSGRPSPTSFTMAKEEMDGRADGILMGPLCQEGLESTILQVDAGNYRILRPGSVTPMQIREVLSLEQDYPLLPINLDDRIALAPGMKHRHYQPETPVQLISTETFKKKHPAPTEQGQKLYIGVDNPPQGWFERQWVYSDWKEYGKQLYRAFKEADELDFDLIVAQIPGRGENLEPALANRLLKASGGDFFGGLNG